MSAGGIDMAMIDLTSQAREGFMSGKEGAQAVEACPHFNSSPCGMAWLAGAWLAANGFGEPQAVRMSRGYTVRVSGMLLSVDDPAAIRRIG